MHKKRLAHLHEILTAVRDYERPFDMTVWFSLKTMSVDPSKFDLQCNFVACAGGWAALDPSFNAEGLYYDFHEDRICYKDPEWDEDDEPLETYEALRVFFGLSENQCRWLFDCMEYLYEYQQTEDMQTLYLPSEKGTDDIPIDLVLQRITYLVEK